MTGSANVQERCSHTKDCQIWQDCQRKSQEAKASTRQAERALAQG